MLFGGIRNVVLPSGIYLGIRLSFYCIAYSYLNLISHVSSKAFSSHERLVV